MHKNYIPNAKDDINALSFLERKDFAELEDMEIMCLLTWTQDMHWDVSHGIAQYFLPRFAYIQQQIIEILQSNDAEWKFNVLEFIVKGNEEKITVTELHDVIKNLAFTPTLFEVECEVDVIAKEILAKL
ncbi:MAG: DUF5071 domain-containing protein [Chitinophagales bacterium]|nr:DUF5071 domain-containing protein [Bacteroidota bacterium]MCB9042509.1 DUF5071 domain-containing protein [Chitinophagales bacterium]